MNKAAAFLMSVARKTPAKIQVDPMDDKRLRLALLDGPRMAQIEITPAWHGAQSRFWIDLSDFALLTESQVWLQDVVMDDQNRQAAAVPESEKPIDWAKIFASPELMAPVCLQIRSDYLSSAVQAVTEVAGGPEALAVMYSRTWGALLVRTLDCSASIWVRRYDWRSEN